MEVQILSSALDFCYTPDIVKGGEEVIKMTEERKGQIALLITKAKYRHDGIRLKFDVARRDIGNMAKEIGISVDEAMEWSEILVRELVDETFPPH